MQPCMGAGGPGALKSAPPPLLSAPPALGRVEWFTVCRCHIPSEVYTLDGPVAPCRVDYWATPRGKQAAGTGGDIDADSRKAKSRTDGQGVEGGPPGSRRRASAMFAPRLHGTPVLHYASLHAAAREQPPLAMCGAYG